jgi:hypothetical protein
LERCRSGGWNGFVRVRHFCFGTKFLLVLTVLSLISLLQITVQSKGQLLFSFSNRAFRFRFFAVNFAILFYFLKEKKSCTHWNRLIPFIFSFLLFTFFFREFYVKNFLYLFNN